MGDKEDGGFAEGWQEGGRPKIDEAQALCATAQRHGRGRTLHPPRCYSGVRGHWSPPRTHAGHRERVVRSTCAGRATPNWDGGRAKKSRRGAAETGSGAEGGGEVGN